MDLKEVLQHVYLFRGAEEADLAAVAAIAQAKNYPVATQIFDFGHEPDALFVVALGTVELRVDQKDLVVMTVGTGQTFGELPFFCRHLRPAAAYAKEPTRVVCIPYASLDRLLRERPSLALVFYRNATEFLAKHLHQLSAERDRPYL